MKNILITGSLGFIGRHFQAAAKKAGYKTLGIDRAAGVDISDYAHLKKTVLHLMRQVDMVVHLAATCSTSNSLVMPGQDLKDNVIGTFNVAQLARELNAPIIYTSTCKIKPDKQGARTPYGLTKYMGEKIIKEWSYTFGLRCLINRPGTIYGPGQTSSPESGWLAWFIKASILNLPLTIFGTGQQIRDVLYVDDYVDLLLDQVANFKKYENTTNDVGGGQINSISLLEALKFLEYTNYNFGERRKGDIDIFVSGNFVSKINGWKPETSWTKGIKKTVETYREALAKQN